MGAAVHPHSLTSRRPVAPAAVPHACPSTAIRINPACVPKPAASKTKKRPGFQQGDAPPAKRASGVCAEVEPAAKIKKRPVASSDAVSSALRGMDALYAKKQVSAAPIHLSELVAPPAASPIRLPNLKAPPVASPIHLPQLTVPPTAGSMRDLLEKAHLAKASPETICQSEIERRRAEARREIEQVVRTVEFNDPYIDPRDVLN